MALKVSLVLAGIAVGLLSIYGADVAAVQGGGDGFLPFDHMVRGIGLGGTSIILPIAAFIISRKEPSRALGALILIAGVMIIIGGAMFIAGSGDAESGAAMESDRDATESDRDATESDRDATAEAAPIVVAGAIIIALGAIKVAKS